MLRFAQLTTLLAVARLGHADQRANADDAPTSRFQTEVNEQGVWVRENDQPVFFYQQATKSKDGGWPRANYLHPVFDLDGNVLTEDFPKDHPHHRGIFWAWHQALLADKPVGDPWVCRDAVWDVQEVKFEQNDGGVTLKTKVIWQSPLAKGRNGELLPLVEERGRIHVHPVEEDRRTIDFEIQLLALQEGYRLGGSADVKGYGGFCVRVKLPEQPRFLTSQGVVLPQTTSIEAGPWLDMTTPVGAGEQASHVSVFCHPKNPGFPEPWILRRARSMQNPAWPGREPVELSTKTPTSLRYQLVLHRGKATTDQLQAWYDNYAQATK